MEIDLITMLRISKVILLVVILAVALVSCTNKPIPPTQNISTESLPGYPTIAVQNGAGNAAYPVQGQTPVPTLVRYKPGDVPPTPADVPEPDKGKASISGTLYSYTTLQVLPNTLYFLSLALGDKKDTPPPFSAGPIPAKGDIVAESDDQGQFRLANVPPGNYFMIVWSPVGWPMGVVSPSVETPRLIELKADQKSPLGVVYFSWP